MTTDPIERLAEIKAKTEGHTEGPWSHDGIRYVFADERHLIRNNRDEYAKMVLEVRGWGWLQYKGDDAALAEQAANGHLAASAPDLLDIATTLAGEVERLRAEISKVIGGCNCSQCSAIRSALTLQEDHHD